MGYGPPPPPTPTPGITTFLELTDTPSSFTGQALKLAKVNAGETALSLDLLLSFTDWYAGGAPTTYPWEFEANFPVAPPSEGIFFSPILKNIQGQYYCYVVSFTPDTFYLYNITTKQYHRLADLNVANTAFSYRSPALSPDGKKLACVSGDAMSVEIYDIEANTWTDSPDAPAQIQHAVWLDDDTIWTHRTGGTCKFFEYIVSTTVWSQFANSLAVDSSSGQALACSPDKTTLYAGGIGTHYYKIVKYVIATDTYSELTLSPERRVFHSADRIRLWHTSGEYVHYFKCEDETTQTNLMPPNPQRDKASNLALGVYELTACLGHYRNAAPRIMSYFGSGSWRLASKVLTDYNLAVFKKPNDGFEIKAVCKASNYFVPIPLFSTLTLPAGTWEFFYPKDGDYTKLKISGSVLK